MVEITFPQNVL